MNTYDFVKVCEHPTKRTNIAKLASENELKTYTSLEKYKGSCELVGSNWGQSKIYFDYDGYDECDDLDALIEDIKSICKKNVYIANRSPRIDEKKNKIKKSYRIYVDEIRITNKHIPLIFKDLFDKYENLDKSVYDASRVLYLPFTSKKYDTKNIKEFDVPPLIPNDCNALKCCASYIEEDFEDWDVLKKDIIVLNAITKDWEDNKEHYEKILKDNEEYNAKYNFTEIMTKFSKERASNYQSWIYMCIALINLYYRKIITKGDLYNLFDLFSSKADEYDAESVIKAIDTNISRFDGKGYGIKYLLDCLKEDDKEYYESITKKDLMISGSNDDIGASKIVVEYYKNLLVICKGILYVKYNDVWISNKEQVNNILIDMIGKIDIKFYGADGKRKYNYNTSIKHIGDCIKVIKSNQTIIDDEFYNKLLDNNKYYLPFIDGIYSFKENRLYTYEDLPNIHFTYKINRKFPKFNQEDYDELMNRVIKPIYPNQDEALYNAHIKARALAGCFEDKKWYGYSGSRNSGKGVETKILKNSFGEYVMDFNAKCLIYNKFGNPDEAKALSWIVDKKDARIIISNEIDGDENTVLNGAFIKTLASGGDSVEARKLYQDIVSFVPQFTMFLCYNHFYDIKPSDAKENLEQFEYKSKFVEKDELIDGIPFLKLKDDNIKELIKENRIIDAYTLYILNSFTNPRMETPKSIKNSTEINNGEEKLTIEQFIIQNFKTTNDDKDRLHTSKIAEILTCQGYKIKDVEAGKLLNRIGIGKYNKNCNIDKFRKAGYDYIKYIGIDDEV